MSSQRVNGSFIVIEGRDGAGKSTQIDLLKQHLEKRGGEVVITREPGGTVLGEKIRELALSENVSSKTRALLMTASRSDHIEKVIAPNLSKGKIVLCDRFSLSTYVYQTLDGTVKSHEIEYLQNFVSGNNIPCYVIIITLSNKVAKERLYGRGDLNELDRVSLEHGSVMQELYLKYGKEYFGDGLIVVDGDCDPDILHTKIVDAIMNYK